MTKDIVEILKQVGAILGPSHFVGTSGRHMELYLNKDALYLHTIETSTVGEMFAAKFKDRGVEVVVGPALGGIILSQWAAYHLSRETGRDVLAVYTEKDAEKNQIFTRGYDKVVKGKKVLVVEDLVTTGGSVKKAVDSVRGAGGEVVAVCVMVNRDPAQVTDEAVGAPLESLGVYEVPSYDPGDCPLCRKHIPINTEVGHGKKFLAAQMN